VCHIQSTLANRDDCGKHAILSGCVPNNVLSRTPYLTVLLDRRERHVVTRQRSDRRPDRRRDRRPDLKLDTSDHNDRKPFPKFLDKEVVELAQHVNKVVNTFVQHEDKRDEELRGGAFLEKDALHILGYLGFGWRIWGEGSGAETRLKSNEPGPRPRWGIDTDSGYENNDEDR
jgi:hypothetical protein